MPSLQSAWTLLIAYAYWQARCAVWDSASTHTHTHSTKVIVGHSHALVSTHALMQARRVKWGGVGFRVWGHRQAWPRRGLASVGHSARRKWRWSAGPIWELHAFFAEVAARSLLILQFARQHVQSFTCMDRNGWMVWGQARFVHAYAGSRYYCYTVILFPDEFLQREDTEAQNGYGFCMLLGYWPPNLQVSSSALICSILMQLSLKPAS